MVVTFQRSSGSPGGVMVEVGKPPERPSRQRTGEEAERSGLRAESGG